MGMAEKKDKQKWGANPRGMDWVNGTPGSASLSLSLLVWLLEAPPFLALDSRSPARCLGLLPPRLFALLAPAPAPLCRSPQRRFLRSIAAST